MLLAARKLHSTIVCCVFLPDESPRYITLPAGSVIRSSSLVQRCGGVPSRGEPQEPLQDYVPPSPDELDLGEAPGFWES